ncbi:MAG: penicillin acylase family protein [Alphaproteobacteria bacterium]
MLRWILWAACGIGTSAALLAALCYIWLRTGLPDITGELRLAGLEQPTEIARDEFGVPLIIAQSAHDAYFSLGFVHAQDRLWQMEAMRRIGAGRLSEIVGGRALDLDRFMRTLGIQRLAEASFASLAPETRAALEAYAAGVNAFLAARRGALAPEFILLNVEPEPWRPADSLVWGKLMAMQLSVDWRQEMLRARMAQRLERGTVESLWPSDDAAGPTTIGAAAPTALDAAWRIPALLDELLGHGASNAWAISAARSATGRPIVATDPHLGATLPNQWYLARIKAPGLDLSGATAPGVPFVIIGQNADIAWAFTSSQADVEDLVVEREMPGDPGRYTSASGSLPFETRVETIAVSRANPVTLRVRATQNGPVISDILAGRDAPTMEQGTALALSAPYLELRDRSADALYSLNVARNLTETALALERFDALQQFVTHADRTGIGFAAPGRVPVRRSGDGFWPSNGAAGRIWRGFVPHAELPRDENPPKGYLVNANNRPIGGKYPHTLARNWEEPYRARRAEAVLGSQTKHAPIDSAALQADTTSLAALDIVPVLLRLAGEPHSELARRTLSALGAWDGTMTPDTVEPLVYTAWVRAVMARLFAGKLGVDFPAYWDNRPRVMLTALAGEGGWCDAPSSAASEGSCAHAVGLALDDALGDLKTRFGADFARWRWGKAHRVRLRHAIFGRIPVLGRLWGTTLEVGGDAHTLMRGGVRFADSTEPYRATHIASLRAILDVGEPDGSLFVLPTGQSGHPLSPHYLDQALRWRDFAYLRLPQQGDGTQRRILRLVPAP